MTYNQEKVLNKTVITLEKLEITVIKCDNLHTVVIKEGNKEVSYTTNGVFEASKNGKYKTYLEFDFDD